MLTDLDSYGEYIEEWMEEHLERHPDKRISWSAWFEGAHGKALEDADRGIEFNGWHNQEYKQKIESLVGKKPVKMYKGHIQREQGFFIMLNSTYFYFSTKEERDADYRKGSAMIVQIIESPKLDKV